jgi:hypothetical protein
LKPFPVSEGKAQYSTAHIYAAPPRCPAGNRPTAPANRAGPPARLFLLVLGSLVVHACPPRTAR